jgi:hypothetical protein
MSPRGPLPREARKRRFSARLESFPLLVPSVPIPMKKLLTRCSAAALLLAMQACAAASSGPSLTTGPLAARSVITAEEVQALRLPDLHAVVRTLHPEWLRAEGEVGVFVDGARRGGPEALAELQVSQGVQVRYLTAPGLRRELGDEAGTLAAAILVEEATRFSSGAPRVSIPGGMRLTFSILPQHALTGGAKNPLGGEPDHTLLRESDDGGEGVTFAARLAYRGLYVQPFFTRAPRSQRSVYEHPIQVRNVRREIEPEAGVVAGYTAGWLRAGVGVVQERTRWSWSAGECECTNRGTILDSRLLPMAEAAATVPLWRMIGAEVRVSGRHRPDSDVEIRHFLPTVQVRDGGTEIDVAVGLSARLF